MSIFLFTKGKTHMHPDVDLAEYSLERVVKHLELTDAKYVDSTCKLMHQFTLDRVTQAGRQRVQTLAGTDMQYPPVISETKHFSMQNHLSYAYVYE